MKSKFCSFMNAFCVFILFFFLEIGFQSATICARVGCSFLLIFVFSPGRRTTIKMGQSELFPTCSRQNLRATLFFQNSSLGNGAHNELSTANNWLYAADWENCIRNCFWCIFVLVEKKVLKKWTHKYIINQVSLSFDIINFILIAWWETARSPDSPTAIRNPFFAG